MTRLIMTCLVLLFAAPAMAQINQGPELPLSDPLLETRAHGLYEQLRCVVCQNQSIADSNADLARDLRAMVRHRLETGASDTEIINYIHERYGDFVLMKPPVKPLTWLLWFGPFAILLLGALLAFRQMGKAVDDSDEEKENEEERA